MCEYNKIFNAVNSKKELFKANNHIQSLFNRVIVMSDSAHGFGAKQDGFMSGQVADFTCFSFNAVKNITTAEGGAVVWKDVEKLDNEWLYNQYMLYLLHGQSPQIINVVKNEMAIIEPRPDLPEHRELYKGNEERKLEVKPGITGFNQAYHRNTVPWKDRIQNDIYYIDNLSFWLDLKIFIKTAITVLRCENIFVSLSNSHGANDNKTHIEV